MQLYQPTITGSLSVSGSINLSGSITLAGGGTISGTASIATTASYAISASNAVAAQTASFVALAQSASNAIAAATASSADNFLVRNTLTAQTLVVQTITSSVDFVTGSTRFGSTLANTHVFSGSVTMNPNGLFVSSSGVVGIGTTNPSTFFEVYANTAATNLAYYTTSGSANRMILGARNIGTNGNTIDIRAHGSTYSETILGNSMAGAVGVVGATSLGTIPMVIGTTSNSPVVLGTNNQEVMRITGSNVGIGTSSPSGAAGLALVLNSGASQGRICIKTSATGDASGDGLQIGMSGTSAFIEQRENDDLTFATNATERMRITSGGNVGISISSLPSNVKVKIKATSEGTDIGLSSSTLSIARSASDTQLNIGYYTTPDAFVISSTYGSDGAYKPLAFATSDTERMRITSGGNVGVNTAGSICRLVVADSGTVITSGNVTFDSQAKGIELYNNISGTTDNLIGYWFSVGPHKSGIASGRTNAGAGWELDLRFFVHDSSTTNLNNCFERMRLYGNGNLTINGSLTQNGSLSDITLKENLVKILNPLDKISQINGYTFTWKENAPARQHISNIVKDAGLIAQEVEEILPEIVRQNEDGTKALNYNGVTGLLIEAIKELKAEFDTYKATHP